MGDRRSPLFVGREAELAVASQALAALSPGSGPAVVLIVGEPGIGKSVLLRNLVQTREPARVFTLAGFEPAQGIPLGAAAELFHALRVASPEGSALSTVLKPGGEPLEALRVFEATRTALGAVTPALIVFDDVQWADDATIAMCHYLLRTFAGDGMPIAFVFASRPGHHVPELARALRDTTTEFVELTLGPLGRSAGIELVRRLNPHVIAEDAAGLYDAAAGSPFWIEALVRRGESSDPVADVITQRLESLSIDAAQCLAAIVVAARPITCADVATLLGWPEARISDAVTQMIDRGVLVAEGSTVRIVHDLIRETAYRQIAEKESRALHQRVAEWLECEAGDDLHLLTEALGHRLVVGNPPLDLALRIAGSPHRRLLGTDGFAQLASAVDGRSFTDPEVAALQFELAALAGELGERETAYNRFAVLAQRLHEPEQRANAALNAARQAIDLLRSEDAAAMLDRARANSGGDPWIGIEAAALENSRRMWVDTDLTGGRWAIEHAVAEARQLVAAAGGIEQLAANARRAFVEVLSAAFDVALTNDDASSMESAARERVAATLGFGEDHLVAAADAARTLWWSGRMTEAGLQLTAVLDEARRQIYPALIADLCHILAYNEYSLGRMTEALLLLDEADAIEVRIGDRTKRSVPWIRGGLRHLIDATRGDWQAAADALQSLATTQTNPHARLRFETWPATISARFGGAGAAEAVRRATVAAIADSTAAGCRRCYWDVQLTSAECLVRIGDLAGCLQLLHAWDEAHPEPHYRFALERDWVHALTVAAVDPALGECLLAEVVAAASKRERRLDEVWARIDLGRSQMAVNKAAAISTWRGALDLADAIGAATEAQVIRRELRGAGARREARVSRTQVATLHGGLTSRELDVAQLVVSGRRNAEIADALFVSPKTVERHLSNIFAKLAIRNRAELIAQYGADLSTVDHSSDD